MNPLDTDTICAIATPPGKSGIGVVRISGPATSSIAEKILGSVPSPREVRFCRFHDQQGQTVDQGIALYFASPSSFTGEDVLELQAHGGVFVLNVLLQTAVAFGARLARPGEFSERAFLNDKLDLAQLEAIADLIDASTEQAARSAFRTLDGAFSRLLNDLAEEITDLRVYIEAAIDFADEEIDFLTTGKIEEKLQAILAQVELVYSRARQGALLRDGLNVVIAGQPNAGKSSLLNLLSGRETAIVTEIPGTTRDILSETISLDGLPVHILDTAGLRDSRDLIEQEGIRRARQAINNADLVLLMIDASRYSVSGETINEQIKSLGLDSLLPDSRKLIAIFNKIDLCKALRAGLHQLNADQFSVDCVNISSLTGAGEAELRDFLKTRIGYQELGEGSFIARQRHLDALGRAHGFLDNALAQLKEGGKSELVAEDLRLGQRALGEITGEVTVDDLLGKIFSSFCVGK